MQAIKLYLLSIYIVYSSTDSRQSNLSCTSITPRLAAAVQVRSLNSDYHAAYVC